MPDTSALFIKADVHAHSMQTPDSLTILHNDLTHGVNRCIEAVNVASEQVLSSHESEIARIDSLIQKINEISVMGVGFDDVLTSIALPLIIALFAFAFPFLFDAINNVNSKYKSKEVSDIFSSSRQYKQFIIASRVCITSIIILGIVTLFLYGDYRATYLIVFNWISALLGLYYSITILSFVTYCIKFNKADTLLEIVRSKRGEEIDKLTRFSLKTWYRHLMQLIRSKDKGKLRKILSIGKSMGSNFYKYSINQLYIKRLVALSKYAVDNDDYQFYTSIIDEVSTFSKQEESQKFDYKKRTEPFIFEENRKHYTKVFYDNIIEHLSANSCRSKYEEKLIKEWFMNMDTSRYPSAHNTVDIMGSIVRNIRNNNLSLITFYWDYSLWRYNFVRNLPSLLYIKGGNLEEIEETRKKALEVWDELKGIHYAMMTSLFSMGYYSLLKIFLRDSSTNSNSLTPNLAADALRSYARYNDKIQTEGGYSHWSYDEFSGQRIDKAMMARYTVALLMIAPVGIIHTPMSISKKDLDFIISERQELAKYVDELVGISTLRTLFPEISSADFDNKFSQCVEQLRCYRDIDLSAVWKDADADKRKCWSGSLIKLFFGKKPKSDSPIVIDYTNPIKDEFKQRAEQIYNNVNQGINSVKGISAFMKTNKHNTCEIPFNKFSFLLHQSTRPFADYYISTDVSSVCRDRLNFMILSALSEMESHEEQVTTPDFNDYLRKVTKDTPGDYVAIGVDSHFNSLDAKMLGYDYLLQIDNYEIPYSGISMIEKTDIYQRFKNSLILIKKEALPNIVKIKISREQLLKLTNRSCEDEGVIAYEATIDLGFSLKYNKQSEFTIITTKPIVC